jgi:hypothetical protein
MMAVRDIHRLRNRRADASAVFLSLATAPCNMIVRFVGGIARAGAAGEFGVLGTPVKDRGGSPPNKCMQPTSAFRAQLSRTPNSDGDSMERGIVHGE